MISDIGKISIPPPGNEIVRIKRASVISEKNNYSEIIKNTEPFRIEFEYWILKPDNVIHTTLELTNQLGIQIFSSGPLTDKKWYGKPLPEGMFCSTCHIPGNLINDGNYSVNLLIVKDRSTVIYRFDNILNFDVIEDISLRSGAWYGKHTGVIRPLLQWETSYYEDINNQETND